LNGWVVVRGKRRLPPKSLRIKSVIGDIAPGKFTWSFHEFGFGVFHDGILLSETAGNDPGGNSVKEGRAARDSIRAAFPPFMIS